jgi:hypothetical protein
MITMAEATHMKIYTEEKILCTICNQNKNFMYVVKQVESKYYLMEMCPRCNKHCDDIKEIPARLAQDYPAPTK